MKTKLLLFISIFAFIFNSFSQQIWKQNTTGFQARIAENPKKYKSLTLDKKLFLSIVKNVSGRTSSKKKSSTILLPVENNTFEAFEILEAPNFSKELALKFPAIKSYVGKSTSSNKVARFSYSKYNGLTAFITTNNGTILVKPTNLKANAYVAFNKSDSEPLSPFECGVTEKVRKVLNKNHARAKTLSGDGYLRKYRLALATTGEYSNYFLKGSETSDAERKAVVLAALNTTLTRINGIFERDFGVTLELIPTNDRIIHLNASTDPFTTIGPPLLNVVQSHLDAEIGAANYDIGHVLAYRFRNYGIAYVAVCLDGFPGKGSAFSSGPNLASDDFIVTVFAHELGHQLGTDHVQSSSSCRSTFEWDTAVEPGSGSTIMGYAGICNPNVQSGPDSYFNYVNIRDVIAITSLRGCGELISTGNNTPTVNAGSNYTIPKSTPFILEGTADDIDNNLNLSYCWEQNDPENPNSSSFPQPGWTRGPLFRSLPPTDVPLRYIPKLEDVVSGNLTPTWEVLPSVSRTMDFVLTVRDNAAFGPKTASDEMTVTVDGSSGPFAVTSQNSSVTWEVGERRTITWNVANTNQVPINATTVAMYLSTDGGYTYPIEVATNVPNNGSYDINVPEVSASTSRARLMIKAENNIFYSINASDLSIDLSGFLMRFSELEKDVCKDGEAVFVFNYKTFSGFNETTAFSVENLPNGVEATFSPPFAENNNTAVNVTISGLENLDLGANELTVIGNTISKQRKVRLKLNLFENPDKPTLGSPENNALQIIPNSTLVWEADQNAETHTIELATDPGFSNIIEKATTTENTFTPSQTEFYTSYYWRVKSENECGISNFSEVFTFKTSCKDPANVTITDITHQSATISWTDDFSSDWEIRIIENGPIPVERNIMASTKSYNISALNSSTDYDVFVRSLCASDFSSWIGPEKFTTPVSCPAPSDFVIDDITSDVVNLLWTSNGSETAWELEYGLEGFAPGTGTKVLTTTNPYALEGLDAGVNYEVYLTAICGSNPGDDDSFIIGPVRFKIPINYCEVGKFYDSGGPGGNYGKNERLVEVISSPGENIPVTITFNTFDLSANDYLWITVLGVTSNVYRGTDSPGTITSEKGEIIVRFSAVDSETSAGWDATVICGSLSCPMPSDFVVDNTTANTVDLSWTSNGGEPEWELEYGVAGFVQGQGTRVLTSTNPHSLTGLSAGTDYRVYLKAVCGSNPGDDDSPWVGPLDFTTPVSCPAPTDFVVDDITSDVVNLSWTSNGSETAWELEYGLEGFVPGTGTKVLTTTNPYALEGLDAGVNYEVYLTAICGSNPGDDDSFIIGPVRFKIPINNYCEAGRFYDNGGPGGNYREGLFIEVISSPGENIPVTVAFNTFDLAEGATLNIYGPDFSRETYRGTDSPGTITSEIGELTFHFFSDGSETSAGWDATVICGSLSCPMPSDFVADNTTANTVDLSWTSNGSEPQWELEYGVAGFTQGQGTRVLTSTNPYSLAGLSADTNYEIYLKAVCGLNSGDNDSPWVGPLDFTTPAACPAPSDFVIDEITSNSANLSWTSNGSEPEWELEYGVAGFAQGQGTKVLTSTNPHILAGLSAGTNYEIYLKAVCGPNSGDDDSPWVGPLDFVLIGPLGNSEVSIDRFEYYPNPVNNKLIIESNEEITKIEVYNSVGQLIPIKQDTFKERTEIDFSDLSPGIYHIQCFSYDKQQPFNIIKK